MTPQEALALVRTRLSELAQPELQATAQRFFKEKVRCWGVRSEPVKKLAGLIYREAKQWDVAQLDAFCEELWKSGMLEEGTFVTYLYARFAKKGGKREFRVFERWVKLYVTNWVFCDGMCIYMIGPTIANEPALAGRLPRWAKSKNRWMRRAAVVALIPPVRRGSQVGLATALMEALSADKDDMVRKSLVWMRRELGRHTA